LKAKVAQLEAERVAQQKTLADTVQEQVSKAVQDQMTIFTAQMTNMIASLVSTVQQPLRAEPKRTVHALEADDNHNPEQSAGNPFSSASSKRWDNKKTPTKQLQMLSENDNMLEWQTPDSTPWQKSLIKGDQNLPQEVQQLGLTLLIPGEEGNMSQSADNDITMHNSGNESKPKSLTSVLEAEARRQNNDQK
jgi:hypothetical protein